MPFCTRCGHENPANARFCANCGTPLRGVPSVGDITVRISITEIETLEDERTEAPSPQDHLAVDALSPASALLIVQRGPDSGSRFLLDNDVTTAGRHPDSDIFLDDVTVSRRHVEFRRVEGSRFLVRDLGSLNGTYVNRDRIDEAVLSTGDEVQIGKYRLVFFAGPPHTEKQRQAPLHP
jgi:pSer/pThr/pTyr-binding forkhead associated (FHA) protein